MGKSWVDESKTTDIIHRWQKNVELDLSSPIIDLGCGYGRFSFALAHMGAKEITAIDISRANITKAKQDWENQPSQGQANLHFKAADISKQSAMKRLLPKGQVGFAFSNNVFQFMKGQDIENTLSNVHASLKKGGTFLINVVNPIDSQQVANWYQSEFDAAAEHIIHAPGNPSRAQLNHEIKHFEQAINQSHQNQFEVLPSSYLHHLNKRLPLYPLELKNKAHKLGEASVLHILFPENMKSLMQQAGFTDIQYLWHHGDKPENSGFTIYGKKA